MKISRIFCLLVYAALSLANAYAQDEYVSDPKIEPGMYQEIGVLQLSGVETVQMRAGEDRQFRVLSTVMGRAGTFREVVAPAAWTVSGDQGVTIDANGKVTVASTVTHGTKFSVSAKVTIKEPWEEKGYEQTIEQKVIIFDPKTNPLVGDWSQKFVTECGGKMSEATGNNGLRSLEFRADGTYSAAVAPFEAYRDYWGKYTFDAGKGTLTLTVDGGNSELAYLRTSGRYEIKNGTLTITGMQLHPDRQIRKLCKAHFTK